MAFNPLSYRLVLEEPERRTEVSSWHEHIPFAFALVEMLSPRLLVELGTWKGDSYCAFCQAIAAMQSETRSYGVDSWAGDIHTGAYPQNAYTELRAHHDARYLSFSTLLKSTFDEALPQFADGSVDLLHIDGCHTYDAVAHDFRTWLPKVSTRGVVLFHDTQVREEPFGVWRLWEEISRAYPSFEFVHGHGLGMVAVGEDPPQAFVDFLRFAQDRPTEIRALFAALGARISLANEVDRLSGETQRLERRLAELHRQLDSERERPRRAGPAARASARRIPASLRRRLRSLRGATQPSEAGSTADGLPTTRPLVSIVVPVFETPQPILVKTIASVRNQSYENWELCIADDGSPSADVRATLERAAAQDPRIKVATSGTNEGISAASNRALGIASGEWVALLDHDDELAPDALLECMTHVSAHPELDAVYTDEDKIEPDGHLSDSFFKPDWSPELFRGVMYVGHLLVVRRALVEAVGGFDSRFDGVQDFELMLRVSERTRQIGHLRKTLYHWRKVPGSVAADVDAKPEVPQRQLAAVNEHLARCDVRAVARAHGRFPHRAVLEPVEPRDWPPVTVLVAGDSADTRFIRSLGTSTYPVYDVVSVGANEVSLVDALNAAAAQASGTYLVFAFSSMEVATPGWLEALVWPLEQSDVGVVAPLVLTSDRDVLRAGVALERDAGFQDVMIGFQGDSDGYAGSLSCTREVSAIRAGCLATSRPLLQSVGGFRSDYRAAFYEVDFCLRMRRAGRRVLLTPRAVLLEHAANGAATDGVSFDRALAADVWGQAIEHGDPYFSDRFVAGSGNYKPA